MPRDARQGLGRGLAGGQARRTIDHQVVYGGPIAADYLVEPAVALEGRLEPSCIARGQPLFNGPHPGFLWGFKHLAVARDAPCLDVRQHLVEQLAHALHR